MLHTPQAACHKYARIQISSWRAFVPILTTTGAVLLAFVTPILHAKEPATPLPIEQMRASAYTKDFAKRFGLPDPEPGTEPSGGIQAMEFAVESGPKHSFGYNCKLKLYLDNSLPIAYPEEGVAGAQRILIQPSHFFMWPNPENKRWLSLSEKDRLHFNERNGRYNRMTWLATPDYVWQKHGAAHGMFYEEYHRDIFPGLAYLKIDMTCPVYSWMDKVKTVQVWLKREGAKDYRKQLRTVSEDFLKFTIPLQLYRQIVGWRKMADDYNRPLIEKLSAKQRKQ